MKNNKSSFNEALTGFVHRCKHGEFSVNESAPVRSKEISPITCIDKYELAKSFRSCIVRAER